MQDTLERRSNDYDAVLEALATGEGMPERPEPEDEEA